MRPAYLTALCGTVFTLALPALAQSRQPERPADGVRLAQPTRTPTAREIDATASSTDTALALFEGVWKVEVEMMHTPDSPWDIPVTTPDGPRSGAPDPTRPAPRNPGETSPTNPSTPSRDPSRPDAARAGDPSDPMLPRQSFTAYSDARVIMRGNMLRETMLLPAEAAMMHRSGIGAERTPSSMTDGSKTGDSKSPEDSRRAAQDENRRDLAASIPADAVMVTSFLTLDATTGTFTKVCMEEQTGAIKHETGTYETQSDRITFTGEDAREGGMQDAMRRDSALDTRDRDRPVDTREPVAPTGSVTAKPSGVSERSDFERPSGVSDPTRRDTTTNPPGSSTPGSRSAIDTTGEALAERERRAISGSRSIDSWGSAWGDDCRVVVDILGPDERRVTVYKMDRFMTTEGAIGTRDRDSRQNGAREVNESDDRVPASATTTGQIVCRATYTRLSGSQADAIRQRVSDHNALAFGDGE